LDSLLALGGEADEFANRLLRGHVVPGNATVDAIHIAVAAVNRVKLRYNTGST
jgi:hypothetical protein